MWFLVIFRESTQDCSKWFTSRGKSLPKVVYEFSDFSDSHESNLNYLLSFISGYSLDFLWFLVTSMITGDFLDFPWFLMIFDISYEFCDFLWFPWFPHFPVISNVSMISVDFSRFSAVSLLTLDQFDYSRFFWSDFCDLSRIWSSIYIFCNERIIMAPYLYCQ